jgi:hypothetical protein
MARAKLALRQKRRAKAVSASAVISARNSSLSGAITLSEEEISDVSLATSFFDKENAVKPKLGGRLVQWARGCGGCGGCSCGAGCGEGGGCAGRSCRH